ncbi:MAG: hypothetical protein Q8R24_05370 [Legionellaceae bacterium]|nr:hypothetical protein [Legionellaceae bacterium]
MPYDIGSVTFEVTQHQEKETGAQVIDDIRVKLSSEEYIKLLKRLHDPHASARNAPYLYLFQNALNKYNEYAVLELEKLKTQYNTFFTTDTAEAKALLQRAYSIQQMKTLMENLREFSQPFAALERWINNPGYDPSQTLTDFEGVFTQFVQNLEVQKKRLLTEYSNNAEITHLLTNRLFPRLEEHSTNYQSQFTDLRNKDDHLTPQHVRHLLSINRRGPTILPLGLFMGESLINTLDMGLKAAKEIHGGRLSEQIGAWHGSSELTNAKLEMEIKLSTEGTGHVDTYSKTDEQLIQHHLESAIKGGDQELDVSLLYYCPNLTPEEISRVAEVVKSVRAYNPDPLNSGGTRTVITSIAIGTWVLVVGLVEAVFATLHLGLNIALIIPALLFPKAMQALDRGISALHDYFSLTIGLKAARKRWNQRYLFDKELGLMNLVKDCSQPHSYFHSVLAKSLSVASMTNFVKVSAVSVVSNLVVAPYRFFRYALIETTPKKTFEEVNALYDKNREYVRLLNEIVTIMERKPANLVGNPKLNVINELQIPTAFITEIITGGANLLVTPIMRNSQGVAGFFFAISFLGFTCCLPPIAAIAYLKGVISILTAPVNFIGMQLMGSLPTTLMNQSVSAVFLWKVGVLTTEGMLEVYKGHYEFLTTLIENPEKLILGLTSLLALGYGLRFLPLLPVMITLPNGFQVPNLYAIIINAYIYQAKEGSLTANLASVDYLLLGLQAAILLQTVVNVDSVDYPIQKLKDEFEDAKLLDMTDNAGLRQTLADISKKCGETFSEEVMTGIIAAIHNIKADPATSEGLLASMVETKNIFEHGPEEHANNQRSLAYAADDRVELVSVKTVSKGGVDELEQLYEQILAACDRLEHGLSFTDTPESSAKNQAMRYYDHLDSLINQFNQLARVRNAHNSGANNKTLIPFIDKRPLLSVFYRRHGMSTRTMVGRYVAILPFAPITYSARLIGALYGFVFNKPSWVKSAAIATSDDILMITDFIFGIVRALWAFALYVGVILRIPIVALVLPEKAGEAMGSTRSGSTNNLDRRVFNDDYKAKASDKEKRTFLDRLYGVVNSISPHRAYDAAVRTPFIGPVVRYIGGALSSIHTNVTRSVSTNDDIEGAARALKIHFESIGEHQGWPSLVSTAKIMKEKGSGCFRSDKENVEKKVNAEQVRVKNKLRISAAESESGTEPDLNSTSPRA